MTATAVRNFFAAAEAMNPDILVALLAEDAISHDPIGDPPIVGAEAHRAMFASVDEQFRTVRFDVRIVHDTARLTAAAWACTAVLIDGNSTQFDGFDVFATDEDDLITGHWGFWNPDKISSERH